MRGELGSVDETQTSKDLVLLANEKFPNWIVYLVLVEKYTGKAIFEGGFYQEHR